MFWHMTPWQSLVVMFLSVAIPVAVAALTHAIRAKKVDPAHIHKNKRASVSPAGHTDA